MAKFLQIFTNVPEMSTKSAINFAATVPDTQSRVHCDPF